MGRATTASKDYPGGMDDGRGVIEVGGGEREFQHVSIGNPQCAIEVSEGLEELDLPAIGPWIESGADGRFPNRTNVSFWRVEDRDAGLIRARIYERGVGETLSSGTGASGAAIAAFLRGLPSPVRVRLDGGELEVGISDELDVELTGTAEPVFSGELSDELIDRLAALDTAAGV
jgi:diaminopimelate epimerase